MTANRFDQPDGTLIEVLRSGQDDDRSLFEFRAVIPPRTKGPPPHRHRANEERFAVESGVLSVRTGSDWHDYEAGELVVVPAGTIHAFSNRSPHEVTVVVQETPAVMLERQLRLLSGTGRIPPIRELARLNETEGFGLQLTPLPRRLEEILWRALARLPGGGR